MVHEKGLPTVNMSVPPDEPLAELVLLMAEPLIVDDNFLRSAYQTVLNLKLNTNTEFVKGAFPFFMFQTAGALVSVTLSDRSYGNAHDREAFPHHDLSVVQSSLGFWDRRRIAKHQGWIGACLLRDPANEPNPYVHVGRALCPFALPGAALGLVAPRLGRSVRFFEEHQQLLRAGKLSQIFCI